MRLIENVYKAAQRLKFKFPYNLESWAENMIMENYHKHTTWSDLVQIDSATSIEDFMRLSSKYGCQCYFSGEHGYQGEWLYVYDLCGQTQDEKVREKMQLSAPLKFRYSVEAYWVKDIKDEMIEQYVDKKGKLATRTKKDNTNCHMVIIARTYQAMRKLNYLLSCAHEEGFYYKPRIDLNMLFQLNPEDVYITSACVAGWKYDDAEQIWLEVWGHFGDSFFLEYQTHNTQDQKDLNLKIFNLSRKYGIQTIIGLDTHYISKEDSIKRNNLLLRKGLHYDDEDGWYMDFPDGKEVLRRMLEQGTIPEEEILYAMMNTNVFISGCDDIEYSKDFKIPIMRQYQEYSYEERANILKEILEEKFQSENDEHRTQNRHDGMEYEFGEIKMSGTVDYFLDNYALVDLAVNKYQGQLTTTSRGSASSYYSSKLLGFTTMDRFEAEVPIYPERFITKDRILTSHQMPDIDYNVSGQEPFVKAARELFGEHGCYPLLAIGTLGEKSGFKLYADIQGIEPSTANEITKAIDKYNEELKQIDDEADKANVRIEDYIKDPSHLKIFNDSRSYQGIIEQAKCHACGFLIFNGIPSSPDVVGYGDIRYEIGLIRCHSESTGKSTIVANIEGKMLDTYGFVKDDFLIVDVVGIIWKLYHALGREVPTVSELRKMVTGDEQTWKMYEIGATCCLNQCEKATTTKRVMKYKPREIKELAAFIAAIRPGFKSLLDGFLNRIDYSNGEKAIDDLLRDCFHYMLYQEAVMKIFSWLGIPMKDSYDTIKKISKKKLKGEALKHVEDTLKEHWLENIQNLDNFEPVYKVIKDSARYSFNAPHALAMANDSLYEGWVKAHYPAVFYEVTLNHYQSKGDKNKVSALIKEATTVFGFSMASYEYGKDNTKFTVDDKEKKIYPNLASIKGIGMKAVSAMVEISKKNNWNFIDICEATKGTGINSSVLESLIKINYFRRIGSVQKIMKTYRLYEDWKGSNNAGKKKISKKDILQIGIPEPELRKYVTDVLDSGNISATQYRITDWIGLVKAIAAQIPDEEYSPLVLAKFQYQILGYIDLIDASLDWRYVMVTNLDTKYSPKFQAYSFERGKIQTFKAHKRKPFSDPRAMTSFAEVPFEDGDILYIKDVKKEPKRQKVGESWVDDPTETEWWIKDYSKVV